MDNINSGFAFILKLKKEKNKLKTPNNIEIIIILLLIFFIIFLLNVAKLYQNIWNYNTFNSQKNVKNFIFKSSLFFSKST